MQYAVKECERDIFVFGVSNLQLLVNANSRKVKSGANYIKPIKEIEFSKLTPLKCSTPQWK